MTVNERIKNLRKSLGLSQAEFAKPLKITQAGVSAIEKGESGMSVETIKNISIAYGVQVDWLYSGEGEPSFKSVGNNSIVPSHEMAQSNEIHQSKKNMEKDAEIKMLKDLITELQDKVGILKSVVRSHERTIADLRRDITIDAQQDHISTLKSERDELKQKVHGSGPARETPGNPHAGTLSKRTELTTDKHKAGSNG